ncbi:Uncharacterised protein [uncultured archaeon]|nr:Uncharacterised protein [uncultured archaeon]
MNYLLHLAVFHKGCQILQNSFSQGEYIRYIDPAIRKRQIS